ncbi:uncharacterized protein Z518_09137 [Rhinocladiella mackenziei CBS 650.93]|uniref:RRM domain-containing protein n=1 Tax=Rhinocladiella mackenziei CBS 650.93 TaxID=1442369 RepID=A0A0D2IDT5_9EURO|nr:uncharacterized protein Z518_09137 [Rhinocladiella mackenziei CBS 650.93]KIX01411.1 hypothetical protein Z518_09137 [Rhinocladiella mackenziei CBS 650.93]
MPSDRHRARESSKDEDQYIILVKDIPRHCRWQELKDMTRNLGGEQSLKAEVFELCDGSQMGHCTIKGRNAANQVYEKFCKQGWNGQRVCVSLVALEKPGVLRTLEGPRDSLGTGTSAYACAQTPSTHPGPTHHLHPLYTTHHPSDTASYHPHFNPMASCPTRPGLPSPTSARSVPPLYPPDACGIPPPYQTSTYPAPTVAATYASSTSIPCQSSNRWPSKTRQSTINSGLTELSSTTTLTKPPSVSNETKRQIYESKAAAALKQKKVTITKEPKDPALTRSSTRPPSSATAAPAATSKQLAKDHDRVNKNGRTSATTSTGGARSSTSRPLVVNGATGSRSRRGNRSRDERKCAAGHNDGDSSQDETKESSSDESSSDEDDSGDQNEHGRVEK